MKRLAWLVAAMFIVAACGSSSDSSSTEGTSGSVSDNAAAVSTACAGGGTSTGANAGTNSAGIDLSITKAITKAIGIKLEKSLNQKDPVTGKTVTPVYGDDFVSLVFDNEVVIEGGGTITLDGTITYTITNLTQTSGTLELSGNLTAAMANVTETVTIDGTPYTETITGTFTITFDGSATATQGSNDTWSVSLDITFTTSADSLAVTGMVNGTITDMSMSATISGDAAQSASDLEVTCDGSMTVTTDSGTETCNLTSDCLSCE